MESSFTVPQELHVSFQRLIPYMTPRLRNDQQGLEAIILYLKLGGEKLARIAIDAFNQTHRLQDAAEQKLRLEETLLAKQIEDEDSDEDEEDEDEEEDDDEDGNSDY
jgi:hypothetical protein